MEKVIARVLGGQRQGGQGIHEEVHPQHLDASQRGILKVMQKMNVSYGSSENHIAINRENGCSHEDQHHGNDVDGQLELNELCYAVVHVSPPND